jgi:hypothetical protein
MEENIKIGVESDSRRKMLKKVTFIVPTIITFHIQSLDAAASGAESSQWDSRRPPAPAP